MNSFLKARLNKGAVLRFHNVLLNTCFLSHLSSTSFMFFALLVKDLRQEDEFNLLVK